MTITEKINKMPKTELHLHLEGAIPLRLFLEFIHRKEPQHSIRTVSDLQSKLQYQSFKEFIMCWIWMTGFLTKEEDFEQIAYWVMKDLTDQNVKLAEAFFSPFDYGHQGLNPVGITESVIRGIKKAKADFGIEAFVIADVVRNHTYEPAINRLQRIEHLKGEEFIGIGLGGSEHQFPNELFEDVFAYARGKGFRTVAHAGEASGAQSVESAIELLHAERIGHGIRVLESESILKKAVDLQIPFEVCPTSNIETRVIADFKEHPIRKLYDAGVFVTVNSDDPTFFHTSVSHEYFRLHSELNFIWEEITELSLNGVKASFLDEKQKADMIQKFKSEL